MANVSSVKYFFPRNLNNHTILSILSASFFFFTPPFAYAGVSRVDTQLSGAEADSLGQVIISGAGVSIIKPSPATFAAHHGRDTQPSDIEANSFGQVIITGAGVSIIKPSSTRSTVHKESISAKALATDAVNSVNEIDISQQPASMPVRTPKSVQAEPPVSPVPAAKSDPAATVPPIIPVSHALTPPPVNISLAHLSMDSTLLKQIIGKTDIVSLDASSAANAPDVPGAVSLDEAVAFALKNNFDVQASKEKTNSAFWEKMGAYSQYMPSIGADFDTGRERSRPASVNDANGNRLQDSTHPRRDRTLSVRQPLLDLSVIANILSETDKEKISHEELRDSQEGIALDTVNAYLKLIQARISIQLADQYKAYLDELASRMTARVQGGGASGPDLDRIMSRAAAAKDARAEGIGDYETSLSEFKRLTGIMPEKLRIPDMLAPEVPGDAQQCLVLALHKNPSYRSALSKIDVAQDDSEKSFAGLLPRVSLQGTSSYSYDPGGAALGNPVDGVYPSQRTDSVMLVAQWAINGGTAVTSGMQGLANRREMDLRSRDVRARIEQGINAAFTALDAAQRREDILRKSVQTNERVVSGFEEQYKNGNRSLFDLLDSYQQLYASRLNLMRIIFANAQASYAVRRQIGDVVPSIIKNVEK